MQLHQKKNYVFQFKFVQVLIKNAFYCTVFNSTNWCMCIFLKI